MATPKEVGEIFNLLLDNYDYYKPKNQEALLNTWARVFKDVHPGALQEAAEKHIETGAYFPKVADLNKILSTIGRLRYSDPMEPGAWKWLRNRWDSLHTSFFIHGDITWEVFEKGALQVIEGFEKINSPQAAISLRKRLEVYREWAKEATGTRRPAR